MRTFALAAVFAALAAPALADPVEGTWQTRPDDNGNFGHVRIAACGAKFCGTLVRAFNGQGQPIDSPNIGRQIVWDMEAQGNGQYANGKIWAPDRDKTYRSKMELSGNTLSVSGCVLGGAICRSQEWTRAD
ncbi:MAG: DUF2147 domain-containing protein [Rhodobacteraceae bacterium]|nr:DUF2147 domain-containing protein [Paracoccaceae bacterium]